MQPIKFILWAFFWIQFARSTTIPNSWSWRDHSGVTDVKNQSACNSGWAFAAAAAYESYLLRAQGVAYNLSEEYIIQCSGAGDCAGSNQIGMAMDFVAANGMPSRASLAYSSGVYTIGKAPENGACSTITIKAGLIVTSRSYTYVSIDFLKQQLYLGVVVSGISMSNSFRNYTGTEAFRCVDTGKYNSFSLEDSQQPWLASQLNHYVLLMGYDSSNNFIFKNSFGIGWGDNGYGKVAAGFDCGIRIITIQLWSYRLAVMVFLAMFFL